MATLHRKFTLFFQDTGAPVAVEALQLVVRTITVPFQVKRVGPHGTVNGYDYNIFYRPPTEEARDTLKRIATFNAILNHKCTSYLRIPRHEIPYFILGQYFDYITNKATFLLTDGTEEGKYRLYTKQSPTDTVFFLVTKIKLKFEMLRTKNSHSIQLHCCSDFYIRHAQYYHPNDHDALLSECYMYPPLLQPVDVRAFLGTSYVDQPLRFLRPVQRPFFPQPYLEFLLTTFCMVSHTRLGSYSPYTGLPDNIIQIITELMWRHFCLCY
jgi:hypothetical protein